MKKFILIAICLISLGFVGYYVIQALAAENTVIEAKHKIKETHEIDNPDYVGWLTIPDSNVDYPVMHTPENQNYYLYKDINKQYSKAGSLFLSAGSDINEGLNALIYGHNMQNGTMFRDIYRYKDKEFFDSHKRISFDINDEIREYEVFAVCKTKIHDRSYRGFKYTQYDYIYSREMYDEYIKNVKSMSLYDTGITPEYGERLITLSTCSYHTEDGRLFIVGVEREPTPEVTTYIESHKEPNTFMRALDVIKSVITDYIDRIKEII